MPVVSPRYGRCQHCKLFFRPRCVLSDGQLTYCHDKARHCKRHIDGSFILLPEGTHAEPELEHGLAKRLLDSANASDERNAKVFVCRQCAPTNPNAQAGSNRLLSFNGLRSHLKEK